MTKKDFEALAKVFSDAFFWNGVDNAEEMRLFLMRKVACVLQDSNERFDWDKFMNACDCIGI